MLFKIQRVAFQRIFLVPNVSDWAQTFASAGLRIEQGLQLRGHRRRESELA